MMIRPANADHLSWLAARAHIVAGPSLLGLVALDRNGRPRAVVGFDGWTDSKCDMHVTTDTPIAMRYIVRPAFGLAFIEARCSLVVGHVLSTNTSALKLDLHLGFREVYRGKDWWKPGVDVVILEMRREECRWIPQQERKAA